MHKKESGSISSIPSQKLIELNEGISNESSLNTTADSQKLSQLLNNRDNEISMIFDFPNNMIEILISMVNQLKSKLEASGESVILNILIFRKNLYLKLRLMQVPQ